jgi:hypothetical protein
MPTGKTLEELVDLAESSGSLQDVSHLIVRLYERNDTASLNLILKLAMSDYGGITYKSDYQNMAILGTLHWGVLGLKRLGEETIKNDGFRAINNVTHFLSHVSSKKLKDFIFVNLNLENIKILDLSSEKYKTEEFISTAKEVLIDVVKSVEKDDIFPIGMVLTLQLSMNEVAQEHMFAALMARWFNFSSHGLYSYMDLVSARGKGEAEYQNFLKVNPYILEPFHAQIWSKPRLGEELVPDFLIRSMDNHYTVIEIEQPDFPIFTKAGELSAKTTHAKRQALDFRDWAINNKLYANQKFKEIYRPYCLVVIGRESDLDEIQIQRLKQENESTQGILRIVGFDWLFHRAKATFDNLINYGFERSTFKETISE